MKKYKLVKIATIMVVAVFLAINILWGANYISYNKYLIHSHDDSSPFALRTSHSSEENGFTYSIKKPDYLVLNGNLAGSTANGNISIIIWPAFCCTKIDSYGIQLYDEVEKHGYMFYVDDEMNFHSLNYARLDPETATSAESMLNSMKDQVNELYQQMVIEFGL